MSHNWVFGQQASNAQLLNFNKILPAWGMHSHGKKNEKRQSVEAIKWKVSLFHPFQSPISTPMGTANTSYASRAFMHRLVNIYPFFLKTNMR